MIAVRSAEPLLLYEGGGAADMLLAGGALIML